MTKVFVIQLSREWVELRECKVAPKLHTNTRNLNLVETYVDYVPNGKDSWGYQRYRAVEKTRKVKHPLKHASFVGGRVICPITTREFAKVARRYNHLHDSRAKCYALPERLAAKILDAKWLATAFNTSIFAKEAA